MNFQYLQKILHKFPGLINLLVKPFALDSASSSKKEGSMKHEEFGDLVSKLIDWQGHIPDAADRLLAKICRMHSAPAQATNLNGGDLFYMPTQIRQIEEPINAGLLNKNDFFVDVGCGPGARLPVYVQLRTGAHTAGIEKYKLYYEHAAETVRDLSLENKVEVFHCDALDYDYTIGNVFFMFQPVEGEKLDLLLDKIACQRRNTETLILAKGKIEQSLHKSSNYSWLRSFKVGGVQAFKTSGSSPSYFIP